MTNKSTGCFLHSLCSSHLYLYLSGSEEGGRATMTITKQGMYLTLNTCGRCSGSSLNQSRSSSPVHLRSCHSLFPRLLFPSPPMAGSWTYPGRNWNVICSAVTVWPPYLARYTLQCDIPLLHFTFTGLITSWYFKVNLTDKLCINYLQSWWRCFVWLFHNCFPIT